MPWRKEFQLYSLYQLSSRDKKALLKYLNQIVEGENFTKKTVIEVAKTRQEVNLYIVEGKALVWEYKERFYPTLLLPLLYGRERVKLPVVVVDEGAVKPLLNGANVMRPGIVEVHGTFDKGDTVLVYELRYGKPIVVAEALYDSQTLLSLERGKVLTNLHHLNDALWSLVLKLSKLRQIS